MRPPDPPTAAIAAAMTAIVSSAVASSAVETGVARAKKFDLEEYRKNLASMI